MEKPKDSKEKITSSYTNVIYETSVTYNENELSPLSTTLPLEETPLHNVPSSFVNPTPELRTFPIRLGWIQGVLIPCLLNIWGVVLFLRIAWVVAQAGIGLTIAIIVLSGCVCIITASSLSAICTNGRVQGGGVYYLISRSLGAELGASVGIIFAFANAVAASLNTIGFCESLNELLKSHDLKIIDNGVNDTRIVGALALLLMCVICAIGMDWETKTQNFLIVIIVTAIFNFVLGACIGPQNNQQKAQGFVGLSWEQGLRNWPPDFRYSEGEEQDYFSVFAVYFPAVTGVQAGANICGDLRKPAESIPKGTFSALGISITSYTLLALMCGFGALRDASGNTSDLSPKALEVCKPNCKYGLHNNYQIMQMMAVLGAIVYAGCWAATLSTALTNLLSVPRLIQALGKDNIYPGLSFFSKPYGRHGEPYRGYVLTFTVSLLFLLIADLNAVAPLITNFYLASYALINFCTFHASIVRHHTWRPSFRFYNAWLSLLGFGMCLAIMVIISWVMALATMLIFFILYLLVLYRNPKVAWGSSTEAKRYTDTISFLLLMSILPDTVKSYNPQLLVLAGPPDNNPNLLEAANYITKSGSFMIVADIVKNELRDEERIKRLAIGKGYLIEHKLRGFYIVVDGLEFDQAVNFLLKTVGLSRLTPNILLVGFKSKWLTSSHAQIRSYFNVLQLVFQKGLAVSVYRSRYPKTTSRNIRKSFRTYEEDIPEKVQKPTGVMYVDSNLDISTSNNNQRRDPELELSKEKTEEAEYKDGTLHRTSNPLIATRNSSVHNSLNSSITTDKFLDLWWLYEDNGLNILLSYIIAQRGFDFKLALRIFVVSKIHTEIQESEKEIKARLDNFRIKYYSLTILSGLDEAPSPASWILFNDIIHNFVKNSDLTEDDLNNFQYKTRRNLILREKLLEYSSTASFIVMTLPMARKDDVPAILYMTWLEVLSQSLPSTLFVRGNTKCVLST